VFFALLAGLDMHGRLERIELGWSMGLEGVSRMNTFGVCFCITV